MGPKECGFQQTRVSRSGRTALATDLILIDRQSLDERQVIRHSASFRYSGAKVSWLAW
mgnify:FL=1